MGKTKVMFLSSGKPQHSRTWAHIEAGKEKIRQIKRRSRIIAKNRWWKARWPHRKNNYVFTTNVSTGSILVKRVYCHHVNSLLQTMSKLFSTTSDQTKYQRTALKMWTSCSCLEIFLKCNVFYHKWSCFSATAEALDDRLKSLRFHSEAQGKSEV